MKVTACRSAPSAVAQCLSFRPQRLSFTKCIQRCWAQGTGMCRGRERTARWQSCQPGSGPGLGQKRLSARVNQMGGIQLVWAGCPIDCTTRDQSCVFLLLVLTSLRDTLHLMFVVSTLSSDPDPFGLTNSCSALSKSSTELEWWPGCSMVLRGARAARGHVGVPPNPRVTWCRHLFFSKSCDKQLIYRASETTQLTLR